MSALLHGLSTAVAVRAGAVPALRLMLGNQQIWAADPTPAAWDAAEPEPWVQPLGGHDAYQAGAVVSHGGSIWDNTHGDGNVWEPGIYGWSQR